MNQQILDYLNQNKEKFTKEQLVKALLSVGHKEGEIDEAILFIYPPVINDAQSLADNQLVDNAISQQAVNQLTQNVQNQPFKKESKNILFAISAAGIILGLGLFLLSLVMLGTTFLNKTSARGDFLGTFSAQEDSDNSMASIEKALINPGTYKINKSIQMVKNNSTYKLDLIDAEVSRTNIKLNIVLSLVDLKTSLAYLSGGSKDSKLFTDSGKEIPYFKDSVMVSSSNNPIYYNAYFSDNKLELKGFASFSQPTVESNSFTFQFPDFPKIEGIILK